MPSTPTAVPKKYSRGMRSIPASQLNQLVESVTRLTVGSNKPKQLHPGKSPIPWFNIFRLNLVTVYGDYLKCEKPGDASVVVYVAKPPSLQRTPFDGETIGGVTYTYSTDTTRTADDGVTSEDQIVTEDYLVGGDVYALGPSVDGTGVVTEGGSPVVVSYIQIAETRAWAKAVAST